LLFHLKGFRTLAGIIALCAILGASLFVPGTNAVKVNIAVATSPKGVSSDFNYLTTFPATVSFSVTVGSAPSGSIFLWQFGDGTNSTDATPTHVYAAPCVYDADVQVTAPNGSLASGGVVIGAFDVKGPRGGALAVCPPQGTAGLIQVELAGGFFAAYGSVNVTMDGASIATVTADRGGDWVLNVSGFLASTPQPSGFQYSFTTSPPSLTRAFTTLEGISASPGLGAPGDSVIVQGRSYPAYSAVQVSLGGVALGVVGTDGNGSFVTGFQIPYASPLTTAGTYPYATIPQILGTPANFGSKGATVIVAVTSSWWSWWWLVLVVLIVVAAFLAWLWLKRRGAPQAGGRGPSTGAPLFKP